MLREDAGPDVWQRHVRVRGLRTIASAAQKSKAGCRAGRKPMAGPPGAARMPDGAGWVH
jgi:hypothetical protein